MSRVSLVYIIYMKKILFLIKSYWREIAILIMFFVLQAQISEAKKYAEYAYDNAADAAVFARAASNSAEDASNYASDAADQCSNLY